MAQSKDQFSWLLGKWKGEGCGTYPTIKPFEYLEEIEFFDNGCPYMCYKASSWNTQHDKPMHWESGFLRFNQDKKVALMLAHNFGLCEILEGGVSDSNELQVKSNKETILRMSFASSSRVIETKRVYKSVGRDKMEFKLFMATENQPLQLHLCITYNRIC